MPEVYPKCPMKMKFWAKGAGRGVFTLPLPSPSPLPLPLPSESASYLSKVNRKCVFEPFVEERMPSSSCSWCNLIQCLALLYILGCNNINRDQRLWDCTRAKWSEYILLDCILFKWISYAAILLSTITLTKLWADSADDKLMIFLLFFLENRIWHFMQIVS